MSEPKRRTILQNAHLIDPAQGIDRVGDVVIEDGRIARIGAPVDPAGADTVDLSGLYLSPGLLDLHVHAYGTLGFADPDSIGIRQGVTTFVEAGGPGIGTFEEYLALMTGRTATDLYVGLYFRPMGIIGLNYIEGKVRSLMDFPLARWMDLAEANRDVLRYLKIGAFGSYGTGPLKIGKGLAEILELPLYVHIGEFQERPDQLSTVEIFRIAEAGDMITHVYHNNLGGILDEDGKVLPVVVDAERRGVLFDIGFGGYNFSWDVAEKAYAQDLVPHLLSSDLQQFNVNGPTYSLANVLSVFLRLGLSLSEVIARATINPARALGLDDRAGSLRPGMPADITVFRLQTGEFELADCYRRSRMADKRIVPVMAFKGGVGFESDLDLCRDERNWFMQIAEDRPPEAARALSAGQAAFLGGLAAALDSSQWQLTKPEQLDLDTATMLQETFHRVRKDHDLALKPALEAVFDSFLDHPFTMQIGLFLFRLEKPFAVHRLREVAGLDREAAR